jgi:hypothetical protein
MEDATRAEKGFREKPKGRDGGDDSLLLLGAPLPRATFGTAAPAFGGGAPTENPAPRTGESGRGGGGGGGCEAGAAGSGAIGAVGGGGMGVAAAKCPSTPLPHSPPLPSLLAEAPSTLTLRFPEDDINFGFRPFLPTALPETFSSPSENNNGSIGEATTIKPLLYFNGLQSIYTPANDRADPGGWHAASNCQASAKQTVDSRSRASFVIVDGPNANISFFLCIE